MEWIEIASTDVATAKSIALEELGVREQEAEFEILAEEKLGLFGRLKSEARVRARVKPRRPRTRQNRNQRNSRNSNSRPKSSRSSSSAKKTNQQNNRNKETEMNPEETQMTIAELEEMVVPFLDGLLKSLEKTAEIKVEEQDGLVEIRVIGDDLGVLIGPRGAVLSSLYDVMSTVIQSQALGRRYPRIRLDVGDYRRKLRKALADFAEKLAKEALETGKELVLEPMNAGDRKIVHDTISSIEGVTTQSEGQAPSRRVVIMPLAASQDQG